MAVVQKMQVKPPFSQMGAWWWPSGASKREEGNYENPRPMPWKAGIGSASVIYGMGVGGLMFACFRFVAKAFMRLPGSSGTTAARHGRIAPGALAQHPAAADFDRRLRTASRQPDLDSAEPRGLDLQACVRALAQSSDRSASGRGLALD